MTDNDKARARISAMVADLGALKQDMGPLYVSEPGDREAHDIIARIERKLKARAQAKPGAAA